MGTLLLLQLYCYNSLDHTMCCMPAAACVASFLCLDSEFPICCFVYYLWPANSCTGEVGDGLLCVRSCWRGREGESVTRALFPRRFSQLVWEFTLGLCSVKNQQRYKISLSGPCDKLRKKLSSRIGRKNWYHSHICQLHTKQPGDG